MVAGWWINKLRGSSGKAASEKDQPIADLKAEHDRLKEQLGQQSGEYEQEIERLRQQIADLEAEREKGKSPKAYSDNGTAQDDDLTEIKGIGNVLAAKLQEMGLDSYAKIAELTEGDIEDLEEKLDSFPGRIHRDDWIGQAKRLMG